LLSQWLVVAGAGVVDQHVESAMSAHYLNDKAAAPSGPPPTSDLPRLRSEKSDALSPLQGPGAASSTHRQGSKCSMLQ
jgi:hypothetical protein